jgi:hypothetical protein
MKKHAGIYIGSRQPYLNPSPLLPQARENYLVAQPNATSNPGEKSTKSVDKGSRATVGSVDDSQRDGIRGRLGARGEEAISDIAQILVENPLLNQALQAAFGARDLAQSATTTAIKGVGVGTSADVERLTRRLRSISDRLEEVEDKIDDLVDEVSELRNSRAKPQGETGDDVSDTVAVPVDQVRLGLSE